MPIRPIVTKCSSSTYGIEKAFVILLKYNLPSSDHVISLTAESIQNLNNTHFTENYLISSLNANSLNSSTDTHKSL